METIHDAGRQSSILSAMARLSAAGFSLWAAGGAYVAGIALSSVVLCIGIAWAAPAQQSAVNLETAGSFVVLAQSGISTTGTTSITGDIGVSPIGSTAITGFGLIMDASKQFAVSSLVNGKVYAANDAQPTPYVMTTAISDMQTAYNDAAARTNPTATELGEGNIGGMTIAPGLYKWGTDVAIPADVTLFGGADDVWIFQIAGTLHISSARQVLLAGGAQARNIFWQVAGQTTLGTTSVFNGNILDQTAIVLNTGARLNGKALAQTAVTLDSNTISDVGTPPLPVVISVSSSSSTSRSEDVGSGRSDGGGVFSSQASSLASAAGYSSVSKPNMSSSQRITFCRLQNRVPPFISLVRERLERRLVLRWHWTMNQVQAGFVDRTLCY